MSPNILIVLTSHDRLGNTGKKTGFWLEELAAPYYTFLDAGAKVTLASPKGGQPPLDPKSDEPDMETDDTRRFKADKVANISLAETKRLEELQASNFDAIFYVGGHGPLWDLVSDKQSIRLIEDFWVSEKPVASVCHGPIVLANAKDQAGIHIIKNRKVTGFTNSEEDAVGLTDVVPFLVEDIFIDRGAKFQKAADFEPNVVIDGNLITGQNPASSAKVAHQLLAKLAD